MKNLVFSAGFRKLAFSFLVVLVSSSAFSQKALQPLDDWTIQVLNQFRVYEDQLGLKNQSHEIFTGRLDDEGVEWVNVELPSGYTYQILGVCDNDCFDLDLELYNTRNELLSQDIETDDYPLVTVTPGERTIYRVKVIMANCSSEPCRYGLAVYRSN